MKRWIKNTICIIGLVISTGLIISTIIYLKGNVNNNVPEPKEMAYAEIALAEDVTSTDDELTTTDEDAQTVDDTANTTAEVEDSVIQDKELTMSSTSNALNMNINNKIENEYLILLVSGSLIFTVSLLYLLMSKFGKVSLFDDKYKSIIYGLLSLVVFLILTVGIIYFTNNVVLKSNNIPVDNTENNTTDNETATSKGIFEVNASTLSESNKTYSSTTADESSVLVKNGGKLTLTEAIINKLSGDVSNTENSEFYGINAAVLVEKGSTLTMNGKTITTSAKGSNAVFSTGENSKIYISNTTINTTSDSSRGLDATYGGYIEGDSLTISTKGASCATLATDRGEGTVTVKKSTLSTEGAGSPIIYSTGDITLSDSTGTALGAQIAVIEGKNSINITNSKLTAYALGNRGEVDKAGIMIYQSMSGDASEGTGNLTVTNSTLKINSKSSVYKTAPMFFVTNTSAVINIENTILTYGSGTLLSIAGTLEWGTSGANGGNLTFNVNKEAIKGNIVVDNISTLIMNLTNSTYEGTIDKSNTAKSITVKLDAKSILTITADSHISVLTDADTTYANIKSNGYTIYYDKKLNKSLNSQTITLSDGGKLVAE